MDLSPRPRRLPTLSRPYSSGASGEGPMALLGFHFEARD